MRLSVALLTFGLLAPCVAGAQSSWNPSADDLVRMLRPRAGGPTRGIRALPVQPGATQSAPSAVARVSTRHPAPREAAAAAPEPVGAVSMNIEFKTGSDQLLPQAMKGLAPLGHALESPELANYNFRIVGHTDTVGSRPANQTLSEHRAIAVRSYIESHFNVPESRLTAIGVGEDDPLVATGEGVSERRNRRVQIVNVSN